MRDWLAFALAIAGVVLVPNQFDNWLLLYGWTWDSVREPIVQALAIAWSIIFAAALLWSAWLSLRFIFATTMLGLRLFSYIIMRIKGAMNMTDFLTEDEALERIRNSQFFKIRIKYENESPDLMIRFTAFIVPNRIPYRQQVIRSRFAKKLLRQFEQAVDGSTAPDKGYRLSRLDEWLDALVDAEVENETGEIPYVTLSRFEE